MSSGQQTRMASVSLYYAPRPAGERARPGGGHSIFVLPQDLPISSPGKKYF